MYQNVCFKFVFILFYEFIFRSFSLIMESLVAAIAENILDLLSEGK